MSDADEGFDCWPDLEPGEGATAWWHGYQREILGRDEVERLRRDVPSNPPRWWVRMRPAPKPVRKVRVGDYAPCVFLWRGLTWVSDSERYVFELNVERRASGTHWPDANTLVPESDIRRIEDIFPAESETSE